MREFAGVSVELRHTECAYYHRTLGDLAENRSPILNLVARAKGESHWGEQLRLRRSCEWPLRGDVEESSPLARGPSDATRGSSTPSS